MWYYIAPVFGAALFIVWKFFINKSVGNLPSPSLSLSPSPSSPSSSKVKIDKENENNNKVQQPPSPINNQQLKPKPQLQRVDTPIRLDNVFLFFLNISNLNRKITNKNRAQRGT